MCFDAEHPITAAFADPERLVVRDTAPPAWATRTYSVIADYGWAERILCSESCVQDANGIAEVLARSLGIPAVLAAAEADATLRRRRTRPCGRPWAGRRRREHR